MIILQYSLVGIYANYANYRILLLNSYGSLTNRK